jgi:hypothetical protein
MFREKLKLFPDLVCMESQNFVQSRSTVGIATEFDPFRSFLDFSEVLCDETHRRHFQAGRAMKVSTMKVVDNIGNREFFNEKSLTFGAQPRDVELIGS